VVGSEGLDPPTSAGDTRPQQNLEDLQRDFGAICDIGGQREPLPLSQPHWLNFQGAAPIKALPVSSRAPVRARWTT